MKSRILVVDDERAIVFMLRAILEMNGVEVETACSVPEAVQRMENGFFHLVITGMKMETGTAGRCG